MIAKLIIATVTRRKSCHYGDNDNDIDGNEHTDDNNNNNNYGEG